MRGSKAGLSVVEVRADSLEMAQGPASCGRCVGKLNKWEGLAKCRQAPRWSLGVVPTCKLMKPGPGNFEGTCLALSFQVFALWSANLWSYFPTKIKTEKSCL